MTDKSIFDFIPPSIPDNDEQRLQALYRYDIVDMPDELTLDRITELAARLFVAPVGLITLIDRDTQSIGSCVGLEFSDGLREESFCGHTILSDEVMVILDTQNDRRFADHPNVIGEPNIRFYAGAPLITPDGYRLGALCVLDFEPRDEVLAADRKALVDLASMVIDEFELRNKTRELANKNNALSAANEELHQTQQKLDLALESSLTSVWRWSYNQDEIYLHPGACALFHLSSQVDTISVSDLIGQVVPEDRPMFAQKLEGAHQSGSLSPFDIRLSIDGESGRWLELRGERREVDTFLGTVRDVSEQRHTVLSMRQLERMCAVDTLSAGIGHEINNPLAFINAGVDFARRTLQSRAPISPTAKPLNKEVVSELVDALQEAGEGIDRIRKIVDELRQFGRGEESEIETTQIDNTLHFALRMTQHLIRDRAQLHLNIGPIPAIKADKSLLSQVFIDLLTNAVQAIEPDHLEDNRISVNAWQRSGQIIVEIKDTGRGISSEMLPQIFDPFFSTRKTNTGTGIGLTTCLRIVRQLGGDLEVQSKPGAGTSVRVKLPVHGVKDSSQDVISGAALALSTKESSVAPQILYVDSEPNIGIAFRRLLSRHADVTVSTGASESLERLLNGEHFDTIFYDLQMPHMSGIDFANELLAKRPNVARRLVFITAASITGETRDLIDSLSIPCIFKPFTRDQILACVGDVENNRPNVSK